MLAAAVVQVAFAFGVLCIIMCEIFADAPFIVIAAAAADVRCNNTGDILAAAFITIVAAAVFVLWINTCDIFAAAANIAVNAAFGGLCI